MDGVYLSHVARAGLYLSHVARALFLWVVPLQRRSMRRRMMSREICSAFIACSALHCR